jgi:two-component system cell cycle response regulator DivK
VSKKVLIVEDNELNLKLFTDLLRAHQFEVEGVRDGREAFARMRAFAPDLVIMDIQMPHVSGLELIEAMQSEPDLKPIPVLAVTAYAGKGDEERILGAGAKAYLSKPVGMVVFLEAVKAITG